MRVYIAAVAGLIVVPLMQGCNSDGDSQSVQRLSAAGLPPGVVNVCGLGTSSGEPLSSELSLADASLLKYPFVPNHARPTQGACFYSGSQLKGDSFCLPTLRSVQSVPEDFQIQSLETFGDVTVSLFEGAEFQGLAREESATKTEGLSASGAGFRSLKVLPAAFSYSAPGNPLDLEETPAMKAHIKSILAKDYYTKEPGLLPTIQDQGYLSICILFRNDSFSNNPPTDELLDKIKDQAQGAFDDWVKGVAFYRGFRQKSVDMKIFGVAKESGVSLNFGPKYKHLPVFDTDQSSILGCAAPCSRYLQRHEPLPDYSRCPRQDLDHFDLTVILTDDMDALGYAQPHYIQLKWKWFDHPYYPTLWRHESGHSLSLDDLYDSRKYDRMVDGYAMPDTVMNLAMYVPPQSFDYLMLHTMWDAQKNFSKTAHIRSVQKSALVASRRPPIPVAPIPAPPPRAPAPSIAQSPTPRGNGPSTPVVKTAACLSGHDENKACGLNLRGISKRPCVAGAWGEWSLCQDPDQCLDSSRSASRCGLNANGTQTIVCNSGRWQSAGSCNDPDICVNGGVETLSCSGAGGRTQTRQCQNGQWTGFTGCSGGSLMDYPIATDAAGGRCSDAFAHSLAAVGAGAANWFGFGGCGTFKTYAATPGRLMTLTSRADCCPGCMLTTIDYLIEENVNGSWQSRDRISHPYNGKCASYKDTFSPRASEMRVKVNAGYGFYLDVSH